jgi:hypothetical protein
MFGYDYEIIYKKEKENVVVNVVSRKYKDEGSLFSLSFFVSNWIEVVRQEWLQDPKLAHLIQQMQQDPHDSLRYS